MTYALIRNGSVARYPYSLAEMRRDNPQVSFSADPPLAILTPYGVVAVAETPRPEPADDEDVAEVTPRMIEGEWRQAWHVTKASSEAIAERVTAKADEADKAEIKADSFVAAFLGMSPAQVSAYVDNNTTTLAQTRGLIKKMALMLLVLGRRSLR